MPDIHKVLNECQSQCENLVEEISSIKQSRTLHQSATDALESTAAALQKTAAEIRPFTDSRFRKFSIIMMIAAGVNGALLIAVLVVLLLK
jgi:cytochrome P450